jgi:hypothetical protein
MNILVRILIAAQALIMIVIGLGFLVLPATLGAAFFIEPKSLVGVATLRADMFSFFVGGSLFGLYGAWRGIAQPLLVPIVLLCGAIFGRLVNLAVVGAAPGSFEPLMVEIVMVAILYTGARVLGRPR